MLGEVHTLIGERKMTYTEDCAGPPDDVDRPKDCDGEVTLPQEPEVIPGPPYGLVCDACADAAGFPTGELLETVNDSLEAS